MIGHFFKSTWAAVRYFVFGFAIALLYAPRSGSDSRQQMRDRIMGLFDNVLPTSDSPSSPHDVGELDKQEYWESGAAHEDHPVI